ncbi:hypothetical protein LJP64_001567 [Salmonella enterica]|nr:hypothetical protein [Salmonella enterica]EIJ8715609.1 hypothetical protein [Salmonella enterica]
MSERLNVVTKSMIDDDIDFILSSVRSYDYAIPSTFMIVKKIMKFFAVSAVMQVFFCVIAFYAYDFENLWDFFDVIMFSVCSLLFYLLGLLMSLYQPVMMSYSIPDNVKDKSIIFRTCARKLKMRICFMILFNFFVGCILLLSGKEIVSGLGFSWFASLVISGLSLSASMSNYLTPRLLEGLSKINDAISPSRAVK